MFSPLEKQDAEVQFSLTLRDFSDFSQKLKEYRAKHSLTQAALARLLGTNPLTLRAWEQGHAKPPYRVVRKWPKVFGEEPQ